jgi:hypothetical protein
MGSQTCTDARVFGTCACTGQPAPHDSDCTPGRSVACACTDGRTGSQTCTDARVYGVCTCTTPPSPPDMAVDAPDLAQPDLAQPAPDLWVAQDFMPPPDLTCAVPGAKRVFVTKVTTKGDLKTEGRGSSGLDGGDKLCQAAADAATLGGKYKAWLSSSSENAIDRIADVGPWYLVDRCTLVFPNRAAIIAEGPRTNINLTAGGQVVTPNSYDDGYTWTGTTGSGVYAPGRNCNDWTTSSEFDPQGSRNFATIGSVPKDISAWSSLGPNYCSSTHRIICFEQ